MLWQALTLLISLCLGQVDVPPQCRVFNRTGAQCVWCTVETQARYWGITRLYDLTSLYHHEVADLRQVEKVLRARGVYCHWLPSRDWSSLENAIRQHWPVSVGLDGRHMILVVDIGADYVKVIDNDGGKALQVQQWSKAYFSKHWDGWQITINPNYTQR